MTPGKALAVVALIILVLAGGASVAKRLHVFRRLLSPPAPHTERPSPPRPAARPSASAPAAPSAPGALTISYRTDRIRLIRQGTRNGWHFELYRNLAYTCAKSGYDTFVIAYREGVPLSQPRPLWIHLHGGGNGAFQPGGTRAEPRYEPAGFFPRFLEEEDVVLAKPIRDSGTLIARVRDDPAGFRFLFPSYCDHEDYLGIGTIDPNNPYEPDENGGPRRVDGLLATRAAIDFTRARVASPTAFIHGTSAGSVGAYGVVLTMGMEGKRLSGAILDSGIPVPNREALACRRETGLDPPGLSERIGPLGGPAYTSVATISQGLIRTPLYVVIDRGDHACCGEERITVTNPDGTKASGPACEVISRPVEEAIKTRNPGGASVFRLMCVDDIRKPGLDCALHTPTTDDPAKDGGDRAHGGEDYNAVILEWVHARMRGS